MAFTLEFCNQDKDNKQRFTVKYGKIAIVDVLAKDLKEAEDKFVFTLASNLQGKTIDFDLNNLK